MTEIYVDADACPVREEVYRVATRLGLVVHVVSNGSRPIRPRGLPNVRMVTVADGADIADDWIAERITAADVCVTADIPLASRCLARQAVELGMEVVCAFAIGRPAHRGVVRGEREGIGIARRTHRDQFANEPLPTDRFSTKLGDLVSAVFDLAESMS